MRIVAINGSPRRSWNTEIMLNKAIEGAKENGADVEVYNLYDMKFSGCKSCFACKVRDGKSLGHCAVNDDLKPVLESIDKADGLIIASPIYFGDITAETRAFYERLMFQYLNYEGAFFYNGKLKVACIYTMNAPQGYMDSFYKKYADTYNWYFEYVGTAAATETLQTDDYDRFYLGKASEAAKKERRENVFPDECQKAYELGKVLAQ